MLAFLFAVLVPDAGPSRTVSFPTSDGGIVYADLYGQGPRGVVLAHGGRFDKESWKDQAEVLEQAGFRVLAIDFRGYGKSRGGTPSQDPYAGLYLDVLAAVHYLREAGATSVAVVGGSMGGGAAARAAIEAEPGEIDRLVLLAHSPVEHPERIRGNKLFVVARDDPGPNGAPRLVAIQRQYDAAPQPKKLVILEGSAHAQYLFATDEGEELMEDILHFLEGSEEPE